MLAVIQQNTWQRNGLWALSLVLAAFFLVTGVVIAIGMEDSSLAGKIAYGSGVFAFGVLILVGFAVTARRPVTAAVLLAVGAVGGAAMMWWFFLIPPVVALVVIAFGIHRARGFMKAARSETAPPTGTAIA